MFKWQLVTGVTGWRDWLAGNRNVIFYTHATAAPHLTSRRKTPQSLDPCGLAHGDFSGSAVLQNPDRHRQS
jgi:hypothetical protein